MAGSKHAFGPRRVVCRGPGTQYVHHPAAIFAQPESSMAVGAEQKAEKSREKPPRRGSRSLYPVPRTRTPYLPVIDCCRVAGCMHAGRRCDASTRPVAVYCIQYSTKYLEGGQHAYSVLRTSYPANHPSNHPGCELLRKYEHSRTKRGGPSLPFTTTTAM